jgi:hypothetical protein
MNFLLFTLLPGTLSFFYMKKEKKAMVDGQVDESKLEGSEFWTVVALCFLSPLIASSIFYYGWRNALPKKASTANKLGLAAFVIWVLFFMFVYPMITGA